MRFSRFFTVALVFSTVSGTLFAQTNGGTQGTAGTTAAPAAQQTGTVSGKLVDAKGKPVSYATVTLVRADSSVVNGDLTKDDGSFSISPTGIGAFTLKVSAIGLDPLKVNVQITDAAPTKNLGKLKVTSSSNTLKEVDITGERPIMEMSVDKKVFNVEKNTTTAGGSASDVLQNVPSVSVDVDGNVSLRGKSDVTILIDGKPATLLGTDAASALQSLPAASIESVEVITNPSAKYDAQGLTGIINIITKKDKKLGINGNVTLGAGTNDKYNGNLGLNARKGKWNVFLNSSFRLNSNYNYTTTDLYNKAPEDASVHSYEHSLRQFDGFFNSIGASYDIDKNNSITLTQNVNKMNFGYKDSAYNYTYGTADQTGPYSTLGRYSTAHGGPLSFSTALDYKHKFKKKDEELSVDATFATTNSTRTQDYYNSYYDPTGAYINNSPSHEAAPNSGTNGSFNAWADYTDPLFTKNGKLGLGFKSQSSWFQSSNTPVITYADGSNAIDSTLLNDFKYTQQISAAYANWNDQYGKFSYQVGLRFESATYSGSDYTLSDSLYKNSFTNLFPSAFVSYQLPHQQSIYLNYSRRTNRPSFWELLPYKDLSNPTVISQGNPGLNPEFIDNIEFSYNKQDNKGNNIIISAYFQYNKNLIERIDTYIDSTKQTFREPYNLSSGTTYGLEGTAHLQLLPIWDATVNFNLFQNDINAGKADSAANLSNQSGFSWLGKVNTNIKLPGNFSLQINGNYESPKVVAQGKLEQVYWVDVALRKNLWKNKATVVINCSDIFNTRKYTTLYNTPTYTETLYRDRETRVGNITFTYRFGKSDFGSKSGKRGKNTDTNDNNTKDRENNLKQGDDNDQGGGQSGGGTQGGGGAKGGPHS